MTEANETQALQKLLDDGWLYHDSESDRLAGELEAAADAGIEPGFLAPFLHLSTHTIGEHLHDWTRALRLGKRVLDGRAPTPETAKAWGRLQVAAVLAGDSIVAAELELSYLNAAGGDIGAAVLDMRFMLVGALVGTKRLGEAARLYGGAVALVERMNPPDFLNRTVAAVSNNLGWELYELPSRSSDMDVLMRLCADTSLRFWLMCGNWINEERALYFRALVCNAVGDAKAALTDAEKALAVIYSHGRRPLDAALLHLARASALGALDDASGKSRALADADVAASTLTIPDLQAQFAAQRAKVLGV
jgi:hypothetical protein